jgi:hypothetical protein
MAFTYLLEIIKTLPSKKQQEMVVFLSSGLFNRSKHTAEIAQLYQIILGTAPGFSEDLLNKDQICLQIFGESTLVPGRLEKVIAGLNKYLRSFLLIQQYCSESNEDVQQIDWARWLRTNGFAEPAQKVILKLKNKKDTEQAESLEHYYSKLLIAEEGHEWESTHNQAKGDLDIPKLLFSLDQYYHNYRAELQNRYRLQQKATQLPDLGLAEASMKSSQGESILLQITQKIGELLSKELPSAEEFKDLMQLLHRNAGSLSLSTLAQFYGYLRSAFTLLINAGHTSLLPLFHEVHKDNLERGYFFVHGKISIHSYLNLVRVAILSKEYEWAKKFTEDYKDLIIGGDEGRFFYKLNITECFFAEGRFKDAIDHLPEASSSTYYHHMVRHLELKIYYELRSDLLLYKIDAFRKYTERTMHKTISSNLWAMELNFLNILIQLNQSPLKNKARSARLIARIESKKALADRVWLLEKARELG